MAGGVRSLPRPRALRFPGWAQLRRRLLLAGLLAAVVAAAYMLWLRNSSLVAVEEVTIQGAGGAPSVEAALREVALEQTTLNLDVSALAEAVAGDPAVRGVSAEPDFPHGLTIRVDLRAPVGFLPAAGVVLAGDGVVLDRSGKRPEGVAKLELKGKDLIAAGGASGEALAVSRVLGAAPPALLAEVRKASISPDYGIVALLGGGLELRFGSRADADLKWRAAATVLADPKLTEVAYLDLSVPDRPVAGGVPDSAAAPPELAPEPAAAPVAAAPEPAAAPVAEPAEAPAPVPVQPSSEG